MIEGGVLGILVTLAGAAFLYLRNEVAYWKAESGRKEATIERLVSEAIANAKQAADARATEVSAVRAENAELRETVVAMMAKLARPTEGARRDVGTGAEDV